MANFCLQYFSFFLFSLLCLMACLTLSHTNFTMNDEMTLLAFKFSIKDPYNHLANWSNSSSICNWVGVTCDAHNRVRILNLAEMGLNGTLPSQLGNLSFLVELDLHRNNFYGQLPKELFQLQKLEILNLSNNTLSGEISWIPSLFTLQQLILHHNGFGGVIPTSVYNLSKLVTLDWSFNFIQGSIPLEIGKLQHLRILNIAMNKLSGSIPLAISNLSSLEQIVLSHNSLSGVIPEKISHLTKLEVVKLAANQLSGYIPENIGNLTMLQGIILDRNNLQGPMPTDWNRCKELKILSSSFTTLSGHIPSEIGNLTKLQELYLVANFFTAEGQSMTYTKTIPTIGYIAPEYGYGGIVSTKVDVYSYGIILLEVFTRKRPTDDMFAPGLNLKSWVSELMSHAIVQLMDSNLIEGDEWHIENIMTSASSIFELALKCCNDSPETRSNMIDVATSLNKVKVKYMQRQKIIQK